MIFRIRGRAGVPPPRTNQKEAHFVEWVIIVDDMLKNLELAGQILLLSTLMCVFTIFMGVFALKYAGMI